MCIIYDTLSTMTSSFDPAKHPRGGDRQNRGRFSEKIRSESAASLPVAPESDGVNISELDADLVDVLESASRLQEWVPDATLVGGSAAAMYANHRASYDHDHVINDLRHRFDAVLDALESDPEWVTNRVRPGKIILGQIGDIEAGVRQLIRTVPLEVKEVMLPSGRTVRVPTQQETLRIKAYLAIKRNQTRDYLDIAALSHRYGTEEAAATLSEIDRYYDEPTQHGTPVADQVARQLSDPRPSDSTTIKKLNSYRGLKSQWREWDTVKSTLQEVAINMGSQD